ncbi:hypothetical protein [Cesiribacter andamanensis]|uniref:Uncharacterized protein n=1 Tax=Cesiribacter andamanensis AMV16 TaxID=1279009 RepID=M7N531_9BACT|nr:hypothetical protein [Cesiribacter andamanensis]EMR02316.1 hypothetical protein ADICEAN_02553 [Cesiribacter andamanensis AMV16]
MLHASYPAICTTVTRLVGKTKQLDASAVLAKDSLQALGMDQLDLVNLILALEKGTISPSLMRCRWKKSRT